MGPAVTTAVVNTDTVDLELTIASVPGVSTTGEIEFGVTQRIVISCHKCLTFGRIKVVIIYLSEEEWLSRSS